MMMKKREEQIVEWKKKRERTFLVFCLMTFTLGTEWSIVNPTSYHYLAESVHVLNPGLWIGITNGVYWFGSLLGSIASY